MEKPYKRLMRWEKDAGISGVKSLPGGELHSRQSKDFLFS